MNLVSLPLVTSQQLLIWTLSIFHTGILQYIHYRVSRLVFSNVAQITCLRWKSHSWDWILSLALNLSPNTFDRVAPSTGLFRPWVRFLYWVLIMLCPGIPGTVISSWPLVSFERQLQGYLLREAFLEHWLQKPMRVQQTFFCFSPNYSKVIIIINPHMNQYKIKPMDTVTLQLSLERLPFCFTILLWTDGKAGKWGIL